MLSCHSGRVRDNAIRVNKQELGKLSYLILYTTIFSKKIFSTRAASTATKGRPCSPQRINIMPRGSTSILQTRNRRVTKVCRELFLW